MKKRTTLEELEANVTKRQKVYVRYTEGAKLYSMSRNTFAALARDAGAIKRINTVCVVNTTLVNEYLEKHCR